METVWIKLCGHGWFVQHGVMSLLSFGWWNVYDGLQETPVVEPVSPFECANSAVSKLVEELCCVVRVRALDGNVEILSETIETVCACRER